MDSRMDVNFSVQDHQSNDGFERSDNIYSARNVNKSSGGNSSAGLGKLFVGGIAWETTEESFASYFRNYGEVLDSIVMTDWNSGRSRGFGFVTFADPLVADVVLDQDHVIDGRAVEVKRTIPREETPLRGVPKSKKIFVGGIPPSLTEDEFKDYFSSFGTIVEQQIMYDHNTGRSRGFGFITFENEEAVEKVLSGGNTHELRGKQVEIKRAIPRNDNGSESHTNSYINGGYVSNSYNNFNFGYDINGGYENFWGRGYGEADHGFYGGYGYGAHMYNAGGYGGGYFNSMSFYNGGFGNGFGNGYASSEGRYHPYRR